MQKLLEKIRQDTHEVVDTLEMIGHTIHILEKLRSRTSKQHDELTVLRFRVESQIAKMQKL